MTDEQINILIEYIKAKIQEFATENSSDGGLLESIRANALEDQLRAALKEGE